MNLNGMINKERLLPATGLGYIGVVAVPIVLQAYCLQLQSST